MIELQVLNKVIQDGNLALIRKNQFGPEFFIAYKDEYNFICDHYERYGNIPDKTTILSKFSEFSFIQIVENDRYLADALREQYVYTNLVPVVQKVAELSQTDAKEAVKYARTEFERISKLLGTGGYIDIVRRAGERWEDYIKRVNVKGLLGISSGFKEIDEVTHGWLPGEDFILILGRTNEGKSWILLFFLIQAWLSGKRVLLYSGEMSSMVTGYRFDTMLRHFSNTSLMGGDESVKDDYEKYIEELKNNPVPFMVMTPKDNYGKKLDCRTLDMMIEELKPDIVGIDQISLVEDHRKQKNDPTRISLAHISEDFYSLSEKWAIPILVDAQANRKAVDKKKKDDDSGGNDKTPEVEDISEADAIGQNATRILSIKQTGAGLKIACKKNRYGRNGIEWLYYWDIDQGILTYLNSSTSRANSSGPAPSSQRNEPEPRDAADAGGEDPF